MMAHTMVRGADGQAASLLEVNQEQRMHEIYRYAAITDSEEGLILVNVDTLGDGAPRNNYLRRAVTWSENNVLAGARYIILAGSYAYIVADAGLVVVDLDDPLHPRLAAVRPLNDGRALALQFRYLWVTDADGLKLFDVTRMDNPVAVPSATVPLQAAHDVYVARTYAYVAAGAQGLAIINVTDPERPRPGLADGQMFYTGEPDHPLDDVRAVVVASTNASLYAYVANGRRGMQVLQLTCFCNSNTVYGFSPRPQPQMIAWARTPRPAIAVAKGLDRDRAVDETGHQIAIFGRLGSRPFTRREMERLFLNSRGVPYRVSDTGTMDDWVPARQAGRRRRRSAQRRPEPRQNGADSGGVVARRALR